MSAQSSGNAKEIFLEAIEIKSPEEREKLLHEACGEDSSLRARVDALLIAHERPESLLDHGPVDEDLPPTVESAGFDERAGNIIGPYKLREQIGEGGMGSVFVAEQELPMRRKVALKVIKPGMDTKEVVARFEAERQALALMDHPNIAKVLDGGSTSTGRPFFVMELVKGIPIVEYCDQQRLATAERLELCITLCHAVQHAHGKGVIHRDLKPSNVLVAPHDGRPVVKIIDFGVAKAIGQKLTEKTIYTRFAQMVGTPLYMSPEQAELNALDVDTRSDIYSIGVLIYELLTGTTPIEKERFATEAFDEIRRIIREEDPPKPSTRLSTLRENLPSISKKQSTDPAKLSATVKGDLDWIVMKCLEKDRSRRYETANGVAQDIERYLTSEPVSAGPPTATYRLRKFVARNRGLVISAIAVICSTLIGLGLAVAGFIQASRDRSRLADAVRVVAQEAEEAERARDLARNLAADAELEAERANSVLILLQDMISLAAPGIERGPDYTVRQMLDHFVLQLAREPVTDPRSDIRIRMAIGTAYTELSRYEAAREQYRHCLERCRKEFGTDNLIYADCLFGLAASVNWPSGRHLDQHVDWEGMLTEALMLQRKHDAKTSKQVRTLIGLGYLLTTARRLEEAESWLRDACELVTREGASYSETSRARFGNPFHYLAHNLDNQDRNLEALEAAKLAVQHAQKYLGPLETAHSKQRLGRHYRIAGQLDMAERLISESIDIFCEFGADSRLRYPLNKMLDVARELKSPEDLKMIALRVMDIVDQYDLYSEGGTNGLMLAKLLVALNVSEAYEQASETEKRIDEFDAPSRVKIYRLIALEYEAYGVQAEATHWREQAERLNASSSTH